MTGFPYVFPFTFDSPYPLAPYSVEGTVKTAGTIRPSISVIIENKTHGGTGYSFTDSEGHYLYDDVQDSDLNAAPGDTIRVSTSDSGKNYTEFIVADAPEEKVVNFDYILHDHPIAPYSIEGIVRCYGVLQIGAVVTIRDITKGTSVTCTTNSTGQYIYDDIRDGVIQAEEGDTILVTTSDGAASHFIAVETEEKVINFIDVIMKSALWKVRVTPKPGSDYVGELGSYTFQNGDDILSSVSLQFQNEGMAAFDVAIINDDGAYCDIFEVGNLVEIWRDSELSLVGTTKRLTGTVKNVLHSVGTGNGIGGVVRNEIILKGFDYLDTFKRITVNEVYKGTRTYEDIITNETDGLLRKYAPAIGGSLVQTTGKGITSSETLLFSNISLYECILRLVENIGDWVFGITPELVFYLKSRGTTDNNKTLYEFGDVDFEYDDGSMANSVIVVGGSVLNPQSKVGWVATGSRNVGAMWRAFDGIY